MLTKKDLEQIEAITTKTAKNVIIDFWDQLVEPSFTKLAEENKSEHHQIREEISSIHEHLKDHDKRIRKLELVTGLR